jgi:hypothetical protein
MSSFGASGHAHAEAGFFAALLTLFAYAIKWIFGLKFPGLIFFFPTVVAVFIGFYAILFLVFLVAWSRK